MPCKALAVTAVLGLLLAGVPGGSDACVLATSGDHACCAATAPQNAASCCAETPGAPQAAGLDCDCDHRVDTPTTVAPSARSAERDHGVRALVTAHPSIGAIGTSTDLPGSDGFPRGQPPPALFLLDCAFLI